MLLCLGHIIKSYNIKYDSSGALQWLQMPQSDLTEFDDKRASVEVFVEPDGTSHWLVGLPPGSHHNGLAVVPTSVPLMEWWILRSDAQGNPIGATRTGVDGQTDFWTVKFHYDRLAQRYYIAQNSDDTRATSYNGVSYGEGGYLVSLDLNGNLQWRLDPQYPNSPNSTFMYIGDIRTDTASNLYIAGGAENNDGNNGRVQMFFAGYEFDMVSPTNPNFGSGTSYVMQLDHTTGQHVWGSHAEVVKTSPILSFDITGNEIGAVTLIGSAIWDGIQLSASEVIPQAADPHILRFDATTGQLLGYDRIDTGDTVSTENIEFATAVAADIHGNYVTGGYMRTGDLFVNHPSIQPLSLHGGASDFWIARLARTDCNGQPLSVPTASRSGIKLWPNPASDPLHLSGINGSADYRLTDLSGRAVATGSFTQGGELDVSDLPQGIYLLTLDTAQGRLMEKVVVKR